MKRQQVKTYAGYAARQQGTPAKLEYSKTWTKDGKTTTEVKLSQTFATGANDADEWRKTERGSWAVWLGCVIVGAAFWLGIFKLLGG